MRALVIGGSSGIGAAVVELAHDVGFTVAEMSRTSGVDVSDRSSLDSALSCAVLPDLLVYCAGTVEPLDFLNTSGAVREDAMDVHYHGAAMALRWWAMQWGLRADSPRGNPAAVLMASTAALRPSPGWSAYSAAKAAVVNLGLTAAVELAPLGLRVYTVAPGRCATGLRAVLAPDEDPATIMQPRAVAEVIISLYADKNAVLAGQVIEVATR